MTATVAKQGDLDGLCGVYSIINAVTLLWPDQMQDRDYRYGLFGELAAYAFNQGIDVTRGTTDSELRDMLKIAESAVSRHFPGSLSVRRPWASKRAGTVAEWVSTLKGIFDSGQPSVAILGLHEPCHWTVVKTIEPDLSALTLADSDDLPERLPVDRCGMYRSGEPYVLHPRATFLLTRAE